MAFKSEVGLELLIGDVSYRITEHPYARGVPYGQEGRAGTVYQVTATRESGSSASFGEEHRALKVLKPRYSLPSLVTLADRLERFSDMAGLQVCHRTVLTPRRHTALLREYPDLTYAVLMPWIEGPTWMEVVLEKRELSPEQSLNLARAFAEVLAGMEERGLAHCDLSGPNILIPMLAPDPERFGNRFYPVELVDVEQMFGPGLERPELVPIGSQGYAARTAHYGLWESKADRFAGAVIMAEMLGWCDERVRDAAWGESYFDPGGMQKASERYALLTSVLEERWGIGPSSLFEQAWKSETLSDCATFGRWLVSLPDHVPVIAPDTQAELSSVALDLTLELDGSAASLDLSDASLEVHSLLAVAQRFESQGNWNSAKNTYLLAQSLVPAQSKLSRQLERLAELLEEKELQENEAASGASGLALGGAAAEQIAAPDGADALFAQQTPSLPDVSLLAGGQVRASAGDQFSSALLNDSDVTAPLPAFPGIAPGQTGSTDINTLFEAGVLAYASQQWAQAQELLAEVVRRDPAYQKDGQNAATLLAASVVGPTPDSIDAAVASYEGIEAENGSAEALPVSLLGDTADVVEQPVGTSEVAQASADGFPVVEEELVTDATETTFDLEKLFASDFVFDAEPEGATSEEDKASEAATTGIELDAADVGHPPDAEELTAATGLASATDPYIETPVPVPSAQNEPEESASGTGIAAHAESDQQTVPLAASAGGPLPLAAAIPAQSKQAMQAIFYQATAEEQADAEAGALTAEQEAPEQEYVNQPTFVPLVPAARVSSEWTAQESSAQPSQADAPASSAKEVGPVKAAPATRTATQGSLNRMLVPAIVVVALLLFGGIALVVLQPASNSNNQPVVVPSVQALNSPTRAPTTPTPDATKLAAALSKNSTATAEAAAAATAQADELEATAEAELAAQAAATEQAAALATATVQAAEAAKAAEEAATAQVVATAQAQMTAQVLVQQGATAQAAATSTAAIQAQARATQQVVQKAKQTATAQAVAAANADKATKTAVAKETARSVQAEKTAQAQAKATADAKARATSQANQAITQATQQAVAQATAAQATSQAKAAATNHAVSEQATAAARSKAAQTTTALAQAAAAQAAKTATAAKQAQAAQTATALAARPPTNTAVRATNTVAANTPTRPAPTNTAPRPPTNTPVPGQPTNTVAPPPQPPTSTPAREPEPPPPQPPPPQPPTLTPTREPEPPTVTPPPPPTLPPTREPEPPTVTPPPPPPPPPTNTPLPPPPPPP